MHYVVEVQYPGDNEWTEVLLAPTQDAAEKLGRDCIRSELPWRVRRAEGCEGDS
jgi:hypothetical protein